MPFFRKKKTEKKRLLIDLFLKSFSRHVLPASLVNRSKDADGHWFENSLSDGLPIILYMHGNSASRAAPHRVELYDVLRSLNYHVIAFDYRSKSLISDLFSPQIFAFLNGRIGVIFWPGLIHQFSSLVGSNVFRLPRYFGRDPREKRECILSYRVVAHFKTPKICECHLSECQGIVLSHM